MRALAANPDPRGGSGFLEAYRWTFKVFRFFTHFDGYFCYMFFAMQIPYYGFQIRNFPKDFANLNQGKSVGIFSNSTNTCRTTTDTIQSVA